MEKYNWSFDEYAEIWWNGGESIEDCIEQARAENATDHDGEHKTVFIGERVDFDIKTNLQMDRLLELLEESAYEFCGAAGEDWKAFDHRKPHELDELAEQVTPIITAWMKKYGYEPTFCAIENIAEYDL